MELGIRQLSTNRLAKQLGTNELYLVGAFEKHFSFSRLAYDPGG